MSFGVENIPINDEMCNGCICNLVGAISTELEKIGYHDFSMSHAEKLLQSCATLLVKPLESHGWVFIQINYYNTFTNWFNYRLSVKALLRLGECTKLPPCIQSEDDDQDDKEDVNCECDDEEFDPMCDYDGNWYTNLCEATCQGAVVEKCYPIYKEIEVPEDKFVLTEENAPFIWLAGCTCPIESYYWEPVCDIHAKQYASPCFAHCQVI